jgi:hypothetical protein
MGGTVEPSAGGVLPLGLGGQLLASPTVVSPVRIGICPVMNAARPAVQLAWA